MFSDLELVNKSYNGLAPITLPDYVIARRNTRSSAGDATIFGFDTKYTSSQKTVFTHSFFPRRISHWKALPGDVRSSSGNLADTVNLLNARF